MGEAELITSKPAYVDREKSTRVSPFTLRSCQFDTQKKPEMSLHGSEMLKSSGGAGISSEEPPKDEGQVCCLLCYYDQGLLQGDVCLSRDRPQCGGPQ